MNNIYETRTLKTIRLGVKGRDKVTGYEGIITGYCEYLYGCTQYAINPGKGKDGKLNDICWFDEGRIEVIGDGIHAVDVMAAKPGSDTPPPGR